MGFFGTYDGPGYLQERKTVERFRDTLTKKGYVPSEAPKKADLPKVFQAHDNEHVEMLTQGTNKVIIAVQEHARGFNLSYNIGVVLAKSDRSIFCSFDKDGNLANKDTVAIGELTDLLSA